MTPEQLTQARVQEALRTVPFRSHGEGRDYGAEIALTMGRLIAEDWRPAPPVDPLLVEAREIAGAWWAEKVPDYTLLVIDGKRDHEASVGIALAALRTRQPFLKPWAGGLNPAPDMIVLVQRQGGDYEVGNSAAFSWGQIEAYAVLGVDE